MTSYVFTLISDLHGWTPKLPGGDVLIIAGDLIAWSEETEYVKFRDWVVAQDYTKTIIIPGNHDTLLQDEPADWVFKKDIELLIDQKTVWNGIVFYGCPWTIRFMNQNPLAMAYSVPVESLIREHFDKIPQDTNVLITHCPPSGPLSKLSHYAEGGSDYLRNVAEDLPLLKLHVYGHIHEGRGQFCNTEAESPHMSVNAACVTRSYKPRETPYTQFMYEVEE